MNTQPALDVVTMTAIEGLNQENTKYCTFE